jgi:hypothetical protein
MSLDDSTGNSSSDIDTDNIEQRPESPQQHATPCQKRGTSVMLTASLSASLDHNAESDHAAVFVVGETARALGHDIQPLTINRSSIRRQRIHNRQKAANDVKDSFVPQSALIVHWDAN